MALPPLYPYLVPFVVRSLAALAIVTLTVSSWAQARPLGGGGPPLRHGGPSKSLVCVGTISQSGPSMGVADRALHRRGILSAYMGYRGLGIFVAPWDADRAKRILRREFRKRPKLFIRIAS